MKLMKTQEKAIGWGPGGQGEEGAPLWKRRCLAVSQPAPYAHALVVCGLAPRASGERVP